MSLPIWNFRSPLRRTLRKIHQGLATIGFIGGSITDGRPRHNWPEPVMAWLVGQYPATRFTVENAAIGATGSDLAAFRAKRDLIDRGCDLVFVEYAVNDEDEPAAKRGRSREGLIRQLLRDGERDIVIVYTYSQPMYEAMAAGDVPDTIAEFESIAEHYGISSVWMGKYAFEQISEGKLRWEEWLPDGLHPLSRGSLVYGESVIHFLSLALEDDAEGAAEARQPLPERLDPLCWDEVEELPLHAVGTSGPWSIQRWLCYEWIEQVLDSSAVGAKLSFSFIGRGLVLGFDFGKHSAEFRYRLDGGQWQTTLRDRPAWLGEDGWYRLSFFGDELAPVQHEFELEVVHGNADGCLGTNLRLAKVGIIK